MAPAYAIFQENLHNPELFETYRKLVMPTLEQFGGKFLARGGTFTVLEGSWPYARTVIIEFSTRQAAEAWYSSPAYQEILSIRLNSVTCNAIIIDGID